MKRSRSTLLLIEQIIVIAIFAFCATASINIIVSAYLITENAVNTRSALTIAESAAESFKAFEGDIERTLELMDDLNGLGHLFEMRLDVRDYGSNIIFADITVSNINNGEELITLAVAARRSNR